MELTQDQIDQLDQLTLTRGSHPSQSGTCWMEAIALIAGETWTDFPSCVPYEIARLGQCINDGAWPDDATRTRELRARTPYLLRAETGIDATRRRACIAAQIAREIAVESLRARGRDVSAIEALPAITDRRSAMAVRDEMRASTTAAYASDAAAAAYASAAAAYAYASDDASAAAAYAYASDDASAAAAYASDAAAAAAAAAYASDAAAAAAARHATRLRIMDAWIGYVP